MQWGAMGSGIYCLPSPLPAHPGDKAIQFLVVGLIGRTSEWQATEGEVVERLMCDVETRGCLAAGHQIGSHTLTHPWLTRLDAARARREIADSNKLLEDRFGAAVRHFCYPYASSLRWLNRRAM